MNRPPGTRQFPRLHPYKPWKESHQDCLVRQVNFPFFYYNEDIILSSHHLQDEEKWTRGWEAANLIDEVVSSMLGVEPEKKSPSIEKRILAMSEEEFMRFATGVFNVPLKETLGARVIRGIDHKTMKYFASYEVELFCPTLLSFDKQAIPRFTSSDQPALNTFPITTDNS